MSAVLEITERQLRFGILKLGISIALLLIMGTFVVSLFLPKAFGLSAAPIQALLFAVAFSILMGGVRSFLSIIDWFEKRRTSREAKDG